MAVNREINWREQVSVWKRETFKKESKRMCSIVKRGYLKENLFVVFCFRKIKDSCGREEDFFRYVYHLNLTHV